jgi:hypothetical protein
MRGVFLGFVALIFLMCLTSAAVAAPCGKPKASGEEPTYGTLTLKAEESEPNINTGRKTGERQMLFLFGVSECTLPADEEIQTRVRSQEINVATTFGQAETELNKSLLFVQIPVHPGEFEPGKHTAIVAVAGKNITPSVSKVTLQRSENRWWVPMLICLVAALIALAVLVFRARVEAKDTQSPEFHLGWLVLAFILALVGAALVYKSTYLEPEIWEPDFGHSALLFGAAAVAAGGASTLAVVNKVWTKRPVGEG